MTTKEIKQGVRQFRKECELTDVSYRSLRKALELQGFTTIEFNHIYNDKDVQDLIHALNLSDMVLQSKGFTYADNNYRLVFVHEDLSEAEKTIVLAHECGHVHLGHLSSVPIIGRDVREEHEANEFSHFLLKKHPLAGVQKFVVSHKKLLALAAVLLVIIGTTVGIIVHNQSKHQYYITNTGFKYHEADCIFVKGKDDVRLITKEEYKSGKYDRCHVCLP